VSGLDLTLDPERQPRRFEVINGAGGRRRWSVDDKARIIAETLEPNAVISEVARRYGLQPQQVFTWRRNARKLATSAGQDTAAFVPAVVSAPPPEPAATRPTQPRKQKAATCDAGVIELEIDGIAMRADAKTVAAVIRALKATS
jgi:transposase